MKIQISDSIPCGVILAISGGCMDAYSYLFRGQVFANAQTGNILLLGVNIANGNMPMAVKYLFPILAFTSGIIISDIINERNSFSKVHWRQISVLIEALLLVMVAFLSITSNSMANIIISLACGIQVETFRKIHGNNIATTMCIGNLRSGTYNMDKYINTHEHTYLTKAFLYYGIILAFVIGAIIESFLIQIIGTYAILFSSSLLIIAFILMFRGCSEDCDDTYIEG